MISNNEKLIPAVERLRHAVSANSAGQEAEWAKGLADALVPVESAFRRHRTGAKAHDTGVLAEVDETSPTAARNADEVRDEHDDLLCEIMGLRDDLRQAEKTSEVAVDSTAIRLRAEQLMAGLEKSRHAESSLLQESVNTDIGVGG